MSTPFDTNGPAADIAHLSLEELSRKIADEELTSRQLVDAYLERIAAYPDINAFITLDQEAVRAEADRLDQMLDEGGYLGPLHGIPIAVKDNLDTDDMPTTGGAAALAGNTPPTDSTVVARLRSAGAIILGKTNMHELAFGITGNNPHYGPARNPYDTSRITGGSSSGSAAAVAAGLCAAAIGTDTGGSVRIPSALCGVVGLKPTLGRIGRGGMMYLSNTCDVVGPIVRSAEDAALLLDALAGFDERDGDTLYDDENDPREYTPASGSFADVRLGIDREAFFTGTDPHVAAAMDAALDKMKAAGATLIDVNLKGLEEAVPHGFNIVLTETIYQMNEYLLGMREPKTISDILEQFGPDVRGILGSQVDEEGQPVPGYIYLDSVINFRTRFQAELINALDDVDALVTPTTPLVAAPIGEDAQTELNGEMVDTFGTYIRNTFWVSIAGLPAISVPAGQSDTGLPVGMQFVGQPWDEAELIQLAHHWLHLG